MSWLAGGTLQNIFKSALQRSSLQLSFERTLILSSVDLAARKGTREKARKRKVKVEEKKRVFVSKKFRLEMMKAKKMGDRHISDENKNLIPDLKVYAQKHYKRITYTVAEVIEQLKIMNHPTMFNEPNAHVLIEIQLNTQGEKKTRFMDSFTRTALIPHGFQLNEKRTILVFSKDPEVQKNALEIGATLCGGTELIKSIQIGELKFTNFEFLLADNTIVTDLIPLRGILKKRFPNTVSGTLGDNMAEMVTKFRMGLQYSMVRNQFQKNFGKIETRVGSLDMDPLQLEENIIELLKDVEQKRPKREGLFITKCYLKAAPVLLNFKIDPFLYVEKEKVIKKKKVEEEIDYDDDDDKDNEKAEAQL